ncbi:MAG: HAMP domain-containing sensor histidine kinase [bacterium]|nr:HAMP domain-containing sensor histidine kinase [bacterium]
MYKPLKSYLIFAALAVTILFLLYTQYIARAIEKETETTSTVYGRFCANITEEETSIIFDEIIKGISFPVIVTGPEGNVLSARNVKSSTPDVIKKLDKEYKPVEIKYDNKILATVHYGKTRLQKLLNLAPYATLSLGLLLVIIGLFWLYTLKRSEENAIFAGMSKETAHQLGTPISSLMGWKEFITDPNIKTAINEDLEHISKVVSRFHKIGSPVKPTNQNLSDLIKEVLNYLNKRISSKVKIETEMLDTITANVDGELFCWAMENMIKNAVDAGSTEIKIIVQKDGISRRGGDSFSSVKVSVEDNGKGIPKSVAKRMFIPGYTTKEYGWGMGLALVNRIVFVHKGKIFYKPQKSGTGSIFTLILPSIKGNKEI